MSAEQGIVFNIQHLTVHDGPGIRTGVFLKGCPLRCRWCSNPEGLDPQRQLGIYPDKCLGKDKCGYCIKACPKQGSPLEFTDDGIIIGSNMECLRCMSCAEACFVHAIKAWGTVMTVDEVMDEVMADVHYYEQSGGGITLNGGEVMVQWEFSLALVKACRERGINTCVETTTYCKPEILEKFFPHVDVWLADLKFMDSEKHKKWTGVGNEQILANLEMMAKAGCKIVLRIPCIPGINDDEENIRASAEFIRDKLGDAVVQLQLLQYRKLGVEKYNSMGIEYPMPKDFEAGERAEREARLRELAAILQEYDIPAVAGSNDIIETGE